MTDKMKFTDSSKFNFLKNNNTVDIEDLSKIYSKFENCPLLLSNNFEDKNEKLYNCDDDFDNNKNGNSITAYYYSTAKFLKYCHENKDFLLMMRKSKNYIPKIKNSILYRNNFKDNNYNNYNEEYINIYHKNNNCIFNNNYYIYEQQLNYINDYNNNLISPVLIYGNNKVDKIINSNNNNNFIEGKEKNINNGYLEKSFSKSPNHIINNINCPPFIPSNYNIQQGKDSLRKSSQDSLSKDRESDSTSAISEKREDENNFEDLNKIEKRKNSEISEQNLEKVEYLVEMFGRKGWICKLCNNFNYETRNKCNRCGITKKPKKIVDLKTKTEQKIFNDIKERNNKKGDWICINCRNLNYSFRTFCNRCKIPKIDPILNFSNVLGNKDVNNLKKYPIYSFSPGNFFFNNVQNNQFENIAIK